jgi:hypothetical protein
MKQLTQDMQHIDTDKLIAGIFGIIGGGATFLNVYFLDASYWISLAKAGGTALVCGLMGVAGKHLYTEIKMKLFNKKKRKS